MTGAAKGRWLRRHGGDVAAAVLFVLGTADLAQHYVVSDGTALALTALRVLPLLIFRFRPFLAWWIELCAVSLVALVGPPVSPSEPWPWAVTSIAALSIVAGAIGARGDRRYSAGVVAAAGALGALFQLIFPGRGDWAAVVLMVVFCTVAVVLGDTVHARRAVAAQLAREQQVSAIERARRGMIEERARIARELHDVVAHHMSVITVQAETARYRLHGELGELPEPVVGEFDSIAHAARGSLTELRQLLSVLRAEDGVAEHEPQPDLGGLGELVARTESTGSEVRLTVTPDEAALRALPDAVQLTAYRVVQEALSNVLRHAPGADVRVTLELAGSSLRIEVTNGPPAAHLPGSPRSGHGLTGLRERVALLGGALEIDRPDGGWRVRAELPDQTDRAHTQGETA